jgi:alanine-synthesizing transaminase
MIERSTRLDRVSYDIRGRIYERARQLEKEGNRILSLHIGDPSTFNFPVPDSVTQGITAGLSQSQGYGDARGVWEAREAIKQYYHKKGISWIQEDNIYVGNGVSELVLMSMQALLNEGDEILIPVPDYPLWTSAVNLFGGKAVHYICDEASGWYPDIADIRRKITSRTRGIVLINPNNPTGAVYGRDILQPIAELAAEHELVVFSDEIYDQILYDEAAHVPIASLGEGFLCITFSGLTKNFRVPGYRAGWMVLSGAQGPAKAYVEGITLLANLRVCGNLPAQYAIPAALNGHACMSDLVAPGGRLLQQRDLCYEKIKQIPGLSCVKPQGAFYAFPRIDLKKFNLTNDFDFVLQLLTEEKVLVVQGSGFNHHTPDHFRIVFLPQLDELSEAMERIAAFLQRQTVSVVSN